MSTPEALARSPTPASMGLTSPEPVPETWDSPFGWEKIQPKHRERLAIVYVRQSVASRPRPGWDSSGYWPR